VLISEVPRPTFGGHEKFVFRNGWLKKGFDEVKKDPSVFTQDDSLVKLGVGKNMVRSIRHWCLASGLDKEVTVTGSKKVLAPTALGKKLMEDDGWDPYLEDMGSLWLVHWQLVANQIRALVWSIIFSAYFDSEFSKKQLIILVTKQFEQMGIRATEGTIEREVDCVLRTYVPVGGQKGMKSEENLDCPLAELDLIQAVPEENLYRFNIGAKPSLSTPVFGFALFRFLVKRLQTRRTAAIEEVMYQNGSPGQAFKLDENSLVEHLEKLEVLTSGALRLNDTAGLRQIYLTEEFAQNLDSWSFKLLDEYYDHE
jgi:hypothetical protein